MNNPEQVLTIAEQYRAQLSQANDKKTIREKQEWFRQEAAPLFKPNAS
jgi:hypothetical protein